MIGNYKRSWKSHGIWRTQKSTNPVRCTYQGLGKMRSTDARTLVSSVGALHYIHADVGSTDQYACRGQPTLQAEPLFVLLRVRRRKGGSTWIASNLWGRLSPQLLDKSISFFKSSNWFFRLRASVYYCKELKSVTAFDLFTYCTFFRADSIQLEVSWKLPSSSDWLIREFKIRRLRTTNYGWTSVVLCS